MELTDITKEIYESAKRLSKGPAELFVLARKAAETERTYRRELAIEIMKLRLEGLPATLIGDIAKGNCSDRKWARDLAEAEWTAGRDGLKALQAQINALQTIIKYIAEV